MELVNATRMAAEYTLGIEPSGREHLVVVVKGTFDFPQKPDEPPLLSAEQVPVIIADVLAGESSLLPTDEADLCLHKPRCDVMIKGSAYAPAGRPAERVQVGVRVGNWSKSFHVTGDRRWSSSKVHLRSTQPLPFEIMPITYERAFGGVDAADNKPGRNSTFVRNPIGCGYYGRLDRVDDGAPMPNTEQLGVPIQKPDGDYIPMAFGPLGRNWFPRYQFAGTYDQHWVDHIYPFLPPDFDVRYHQAAPEDQQIPYPSGGEDVVLLNLSVEGRVSFRLPRAAACIIAAPRNGDREELAAVIDTIDIEPDARRFTICWRSSRPLRRSLFEIDEVIVGRVGLKFFRERDGLPLPFPAWAGHQRSAPPLGGSS